MPVKWRHAAKVPGVVHPLCGVVAFGQSEQNSPASIEKIKKYMSLGMYEEAAAAIENAVKENEFDPHPRSSLWGNFGTSATIQTSFSKQFELWSRLDTGSWQALQRVAITAEMIKTTSIMNLRDDDPAKFAAWLKAYNS